MTFKHRIQSKELHFLSKYITDFKQQGQSIYLIYATLYNIKTGIRIRATVSFNLFIDCNNYLH